MLSPRPTLWVVVYVCWGSIDPVWRSEVDIDWPEARPVSAAPTSSAVGRHHRSARGGGDAPHDAPHGPQVCVLVVASDGVWDVMSNEAVFAVAIETLHSTNDPDKAAAAICKAAVGHGSQDDITVVVVWVSSKVRWAHPRLARGSTFSP